MKLRLASLALLALMACSGSKSTGSATGGGAASGGASSSSSTASTGGAAASSSGAPSSSSSSGSSSASSSSSSSGSSGGVPGVWVDVTPSNAQLVMTGGCGDYGVQTVVVDPAMPSNLYADFNCQGVWKSTDYGQTWSGPGNADASIAGAGGIAIGRKGGPPAPPVLYLANIRDPGTGFWVSADDGVTWTNHNIAPAPGSRQDVYPPVVDPYDGSHLLMAGHEQDLLVESVDGGVTWTNVTLAAGMLENGGTGAIFFIDMGSASATRTSFLWLGQQSGGTYGTWRTTTGGQSWAQVEHNEHPHGGSQIYQPGSGVIYMAGAYSALGWGVLRSTDHGQTWAHVGGTGNEATVFGTPKAVYAMYGWAIGAGQMVDPSLEVAPQPGTGTWATPGTPAAMTQGPGSAAVSFDGAHSIVVAACYNAGLWRYVEP